MRNILVGFLLNEDLIDDFDLEEELDELDSKCVVFGRSCNRDHYFSIVEGDCFVGLELFDFSEDESGVERVYSLYDITQRIIELRLIVKNQLDLDIADLPEPMIYSSVEL